MPKPKQVWKERDLPLLLKKNNNKTFDCLLIIKSKSVFFWWLVSVRYRAVEHQVPRQDTGEISPGRGRERGKVFGGGGGGGGGWFRGFVFISSWVLPPGVGQYPSHAVSALIVRKGSYSVHRSTLGHKNRMFSQKSTALRLPIALSILPMTWLLGMALPHS